MYFYLQIFIAKSHWSAWSPLASMTPSEDPAAAQAQNQGYDLACPNIHPICNLLKHMQGLDPQTEPSGPPQHRTATGHLYIFFEFQQIKNYVDILGIRSDTHTTHVQH